METVADEEFSALWHAVRPFTLTSREKAFEFFVALREAGNAERVGDIVICGPWRGGLIMLAKLMVDRLGMPRRQIRAYHGAAEHVFAGGFAAASIDIDATLRRAGLAGGDVHIAPEVTGQALDVDATSQIAILFIDTIMFDPVSLAGAKLLANCLPTTSVIFDCFDDQLLRCEISRGARQVATKGNIPNIAQRYDYLPAGMRDAGLMLHFPSLTSRDPSAINWPYLRSEVPHRWRSDSRSSRYPDTGVQSFEEAVVLFNNALPFGHHRGLEIGCHYAWSTAHLLAAGLHLDVIDPALGFDDQLSDVTDSLRRVETNGSFQLWAGYSPSIVPAVRAVAPASWSFVFIDGYHEGRSPIDDVEAVIPFCADDACIMFHDLTSPFVAAGLRSCARAGWRVAVYDTMQIMGIAWRGKATPVAHIRDNRIDPARLPHLSDIGFVGSR